ncbi:MAG: right-handed parallel beta-helix repeat-containing protein, partial [Crocinitomicaceae bacterium]|nr:right-handed parallel beta-helix repeat-containing protein [Crocinitomicaceae bacterium]
LVFEAGVELDFIKGAGFISYSPVEMNGTEENPIRITSSDGTASGFTVLAPKQKSTMSHVVFSKMNTMNKNNWILTGAVTFYEAEIKIEYCTFEDNNCEDGLNLIRCNFEMSNSTVSGALSDGFDADFCTGTLTSSTFKNTGNDCIDFSGSKVKITDCIIVNAGDKGISGGEGSDLEISNCSVNGAYIGVASKDLSIVLVSNLTLVNCEYGFAAYRKKPEYGPAEIKVSSMKKNQSKHLHLLEKGSKLIYLEKEYVGTRKFDIDAMYMAYAK